MGCVGKEALDGRCMSSPLIHPRSRLPFLYHFKVSKHLIPPRVSFTITLSLTHPCLSVALRYVVYFFLLFFHPFFSFLLSSPFARPFPSALLGTSPTFLPFPSFPLVCPILARPSEHKHPFSLSSSPTFCPFRCLFF